MTGLEIRDVKPSGRGLYAKADVPAGAVLLRNPVVDFPMPETAALEATALRDYYFVIAGTAFICLGVGSLVNHSDDPNSDCDLDTETRELVFTAVRPITAGEQVTFDYAWDEYPWEAAAGPVVPGGPSVDAEGTA